jgi:hypothetical protein
MFEEDDPDETTEAATRTQADFNQSVRDSIEALAKQAEATENAKSSIATLTGEYETLNEELTAYRSQADSASDATSKLAVGLGVAGTALAGLALGANMRAGTADVQGVIGGLFQDIADVGDQAKGVLNSMLSQVDGLFDVMQRHGGPLRQEFFEVQQAFGGAFGEIDQAAGRTNAQAAEANRAMTEMYEEFYSGIEGTELTMFDLFEDQKELSALFHTMASDNRDAVAFLAGDARETTESSALAMKALNISQADSAAFVSRQIDMTGEANDDLLMNVAKTIKATEEASGISSKIIATNVVDMTKDVANFGNMTESSMAAASAQMAQMGLDFQSLSSVVGQFQSFEGAAQAAANLNALMGINIDVTEAMTAANEGQHHMMDLVRTSMLDAGVTADNFTDNLAMARATAQQYNLSVDEMQRILAAQDVDDIQSILEGQSDALEAGPEGEYTQEDLIRDFDTDMARVQRTINMTATEFREAFTNAQMRAGMSQTQSELALMSEDTERAANSTVRFANALGNIPGELAEGALGGVREGLTGDEGFLGLTSSDLRRTASAFDRELRPVADSMGEGMGRKIASTLKEQLESETGPVGELYKAMSGFQTELRENIADVGGEITLNPAALSNIGEGLVEMAMGTDVGRRIGQGLTEGLAAAALDRDGNVASSFGTIFATLDSVVKNNGWKPGSASPKGLEIMQGLTDAALEDETFAPALTATMLSPLAGIQERYTEVTTALAEQIGARGAQIASQFSELQNLSLEAPELAPIEVSLAGGITRLNEASQALITAATENAPNININLSLELTDEGKGNLIASLANGSVSGGQGVLTQRI